MRVVAGVILLGAFLFPVPVRSCPKKVAFLGPASAVAGFPADSGAPHRVTTLVGPHRRPTMLHMCLVTGEFRVVAPDGTEAFAVVLPVNRRRLGAFADTAEIFRTLAARVPLRRNGVYYERPGLTAGERFHGRYRFTAADRVAHFRKHVLGLRSSDSLSEFRLRRRLDVDFPELREEFEREFQTVEEDDRYGLLLTYAHRYEELAARFVASGRPTILSYTHADMSRPGIASFITYRFDPETGEFLVADTSRERLVTYYRVTPESMRWANEHLESRGLSPVTTPFEYFLSLVSQAAD